MPKNPAKELPRTGNAKAEREGEALLYAARDYLNAIGWTALVGSVDRIQQRHGEAQGNYELVIKFTGGRKQTEKYHGRGRA